MSRSLPLDLEGSLEPKDGRSAEWRWDALALGVLLLASLFFNRAMLGEDWARSVPVPHAPESVSEPGVYPGTDLGRPDQEFVAWLVGRNAATLLRAPLDLYDAEPCFPAEHSLALGEPGLSMGVLGVPFALWSGDPIVTYNGVLFVLPLISGFAFYRVARRWTRLPAAALAGALFYAFHPLKVHDPVHFFVYDTVWTVLALYFAERLVSDARLRDALGLWAVTTMQLAGSLYPTLAAAIVGVPFMVWLLVSRRPPLRTWLAVAGVGVGVLLSGAVLFAPFFAHAGEGTLAPRSLQVFRPLQFLSPSQAGFPGFVALALIGAGLVWPKERSLPGIAGDPRFLLLGAALAIQGISIGALAGDFTVPVVWSPDMGSPPNLYMALAQWIPGLGVVRAPAAIFNAAVPLLALLVSVGVAALLRSLPAARRAPAAALLVGILGVLALYPQALGLRPDFVFTPYVLRPDQAQLDFYAALEAMGNRGPLLEVPATPRRPDRESHATLLTAYHRRRSGQCYNSYHTPEVERVRAVSEGLPEPEAVRELASMGFTTLIVRYPPRDSGSALRRRRFEAAASGAAPVLRERLRTPTTTAYEIVPPAR